jgi:hypothetical protein
MPRTRPRCRRRRAPRRPHAPRPCSGLVRRQRRIRPRTPGAPPPRCPLRAPRGARAHGRTRASAPLRARVRPAARAPRGKRRAHAASGGPRRTRGRRARRVAAAASALHERSTPSPFRSAGRPAGLLLSRTASESARSSPPRTHSSLEVEHATAGPCRCGTRPGLGPRLGWTGLEGLRRRRRPPASRRAARGALARHAAARRLWRRRRTLPRRRRSAG